MDIEKQFDDYVINKIKTLMQAGKRWEIISSKMMDDWITSHLSNGYATQQHYYYIRQAKLGECLIVTTYYPDFKNSFKVIAAEYAGETVSEKCKEELTKIINEYNNVDATMSREDRLKQIIEGKI